MKPVVLIILDGFGYDSHATESPWQLAAHPNFSEIEKWYPFTTLQASGLAVGLPWGEEGNSEVGHLALGSGRIIYNHLPRIITAIHDGKFEQNEAFVEAVKHVKTNKSRLHIMGLFSSGSVHAYTDHLYALLNLAKNNNIEKTYLHLFTDGRDAPQNESAKFFGQLEQRLEKKYPNIKIGSVIGRRFAMDRDGNWNFTKKAYDLFVEGIGKEFEFASMHIEDSYKKELTDEFVEPGFNKNSERIQNGDAVIFFNYREDSSRQLTSAFIQTGFDKFPRKKVADLSFITMTEYSPELPALVAFPPIKVRNPLAKIVSLAGLKQLHIAENEKYAHVTYFFNGGQEEPFENEDRILIPSPKTPYYDQVPEMSARKITEKILEKLSVYDFIVVNFANADMVGHTGNFEACIKAVEILDECIGKIVPKILDLGGAAVITADHGNVEEKIYKLSGEKRTKHTTNPVPFYLIGKSWLRPTPRQPEEIAKKYKETNGTLTDVAPTILEILGVQKPEEMIGQSLTSKLN
ncbi:2,3-bisphosphoglycerate-independent phosphoglycerate mutase [Patescibacteria group bacterium]|nr:2,3-bisphosphoglycerate-independent phosphoglycerate mutase [Patescibacteria group bacterium]